MIKKANFQAIPSCYSDELKRVISWCLKVRYKDRPSTKEMISIPEINLRLRKHRIEENRKLKEKKKEEIMRREERIEQMRNEIERLSESMREEVKMINL